MKPRPFNDYFLGGSVLIVTAAVLLVITVFSGRGDLTTATIVLAGTSCFIAGIFLLTLSKGEPLDTRMVSLLPVAGTINVSRMCADLGAGGDACFVPVNGTVKEVIPVSDTIPQELPENGSYLTGETGNGVIVTPAGIPLLTFLEKTHGLRLPSEPDALLAAIGEVCTDVLEIADTVQTTAEGDAVIVDLQGYRLISGCKTVMQESPKCCTMHPCPVCSLIACMYAKGTNQPVTISRVSVGKKDVKIFLKPTIPGKKEGETVPPGAGGEFPD